MLTLVVLPAESVLGEADSSNLLAAAGVTTIELLLPEIVADESPAVIVCTPAVSSVAMTVALPPVNEALPKLAPTTLSASVTESLKPVTTLLNWSSAVMLTPVVLPAESVLGEAETRSWLAAAGVTTIELLLPEIVADESLAVMVCVPDLSSVAVTVALPLVNKTPPKLAPTKLSESVTESLKPVTTLLNWSSAVMLTPAVLPAESVLGEAETSSWLAAAGVTTIELLLPEIVADESPAVMVCVPALSSVADTVALPPVNKTPPKLVPAKLSESVTESLKPVTTLLNWSSAVMLTLVVLPAENVLGEAETSSWLAAADETEIELLVPEIVAAESLAVIVCVPALSSVAMTVALPLANKTLPKLAPATSSESVTESLKLVTTLLNWSSAVMLTLVVLPAENVLGEADTSSWLVAAGVTVIGPLVMEIVAA